MDQEILKNKLETALKVGKPAIFFGEVATYIPELRNVNKDDLGICVCTKDGIVCSAGDADVRFTIQSISKIISLAIALEECGFKRVFSKVGMEPSGEAFNSLVELDLNSNRPFNPMINSGALTIASLLTPHKTFEDMLEHARTLCSDPEIEINQAVFESEMAHVSRNRAIAYLLESKGIIENDVEESLEFYTKMCSLNVTAKSLANLALLLACDGVHPETGEQLLSKDVVRVIKTIMMTCGMYDGSGEFAVHVGIPTKSGVGGGLLSVVDKRMGIGIYSPSLDPKGNCIAGRPILEYLAQEFHLHVFD